MSDDSRVAVAQAFRKQPNELRHRQAGEDEIRAFESRFGGLPEDVRWFLIECGGGVVGSEWVDGIEQLPASQQKYLGEKAAMQGRPGWTMEDVIVIGWDGAGNPMAVSRRSGQVLVEDHNAGGVHVLADSFEHFLRAGLLPPRSR